MLQRSDVVNYFIKRGGYQRYLEIGVAAGATFNAVEAAHKVAVDPNFQTAVEILRGETFEITSDRFFDEHPTAEFDIVFIDGLHTFEQALRDFIRAMGRVQKAGIILLDDCNPSGYLASLNDHALCTAGKIQSGVQDRDWMGDVYRTILFIREYFDNISLSYIKNTAGIVAVWFEPRMLSPWFQSIEEIARCEYARFKYELLARLPQMTLEEIGDSVFFFGRNRFGLGSVTAPSSPAPTKADDYDFIDAGYPFSTKYPPDFKYSGLVQTETFDHETYLAKFSNRIQRLPPVGAYKLRNVDVTGANMIVSRNNHENILSSLPGMGWTQAHIDFALADEKLAVGDAGQNRIRNLAGKYVILSCPGAFTYGHVLVDTSLRIQLAKAMGLFTGVKFLIQSPVHSWYLPFLSIAGISLDDCVTIGRAERCFVEEVYIPTLTGINGALNHSVALHSFRRMKETINNILGPDHQRGAAIFPLHTTMSSINHPRGVIDRDAITLTLERRFGIEVFDPLKLSFAEQVAKFRSARLVVGEDSSALHNILWSDGADLAVLAPKETFNYYHIGIQAVNGGRTAITWGEVCDEKTGAFRVDLDGLCRTLESLLPI